VPRDIARRPFNINGQIVYPIDSGLNVREIGVAAALWNCLDQRFSGHVGVAEVACLEFFVRDGAELLYGSVEVSERGVHPETRNRIQRVTLLGAQVGASSISVGTASPASSAPRDNPTRLEATDRAADAEKAHVHSRRWFRRQRRAHCAGVRQIA